MNSEMRTVTGGSQIGHQYGFGADITASYKDSGYDSSATVSRLQPFDEESTSAVVVSSNEHSLKEEVEDSTEENYAERKNVSVCIKLLIFVNLD